MYNRRMSSRCPLLCLPAELRLLIYKNIGDLESEYPRGSCTLVLRTCNDTLYSQQADPSAPWKSFSRLLRTCRVINQEATDFLYEQVLFEICIDTRPGAPGNNYEGWCWVARHRALRTLQECAFLQRIKHVRVDPSLHYYDGIFSIPRALSELIDQLHDINTKPIVSLELSHDSELRSSEDLSSLDLGLYRRLDKAKWETFLKEMAGLKTRCCFQLESHWMRDSRWERIEQLAHAVEGSVQLYQLNC